MSWDVVLSSPQGGMGSKDQARETFLSAIERIIGEAVLRRGPTEVDIDPSFRYEIGFSGHRRAIESISIAFHLVKGDPHKEPQHPAWRFLEALKEHTGWVVEDRFSGTEVV